MSRSIPAHGVTQRFVRTEPPRGNCVAWVVVEGKAVQCGAKCKGQYCDEHKGVTTPEANPLTIRKGGSGI